MNQDAAEQCISASKAAMAAGDWDKAIRLLDKAIRLNPDNAVRFIRPNVRCGLRKCVLWIVCSYETRVLQAEAHVLKMKATSVRSMHLLARVHLQPSILAASDGT
eukprot:COSAG02_NODE_585_length_19988_cov_11.056061_4_plen_105_part_00